MIKSLLHSLILVALLTGCRTPPQPNATNTPPADPTFTATIPSLPTSTPPALAYVGGSLPCFAGPQVDGNIVGTIEITDAPEIQGVDSSGQFWAVRREDGGYCWIEAAYVTASNDPVEVDILMPTATPKPPAPPAPKNASAKYTCFMIVAGPRHVDAMLSWEETQGAEGYRVYRDGKEIADLDASKTLFSTTIESGLFGSASGLAIYTLEAYNSSGESTVEFTIKWFCNQ